MIHEKGVFGWLKVTCVKQYKDKEKCEENGAIFMNTYISHKLQSQFLSNLVCRVAYMEGIKYVNLIEITPAVIEIRGVKNGKLTVSVNNTLVPHSFVGR